MHVKVYNVKSKSLISLKKCACHYLRGVIFFLYKITHNFYAELKVAKQSSNNTSKKSLFQLCSSLSSIFFSIPFIDKTGRVLKMLQPFRESKVSYSDHSKKQAVIFSTATIRFFIPFMHKCDWALVIIIPSKGCVLAFSKTAAAAGLQTQSEADGNGK